MSDTKNKYGLFIGFVIIFVVILVSVLFAKLGNNTNDLTFNSLLTWLENYTPWINNLSFIDLTIPGDWGWFDGFRNFINVLSGIFSFGLYLTGALVNAISYITGLVQFLFIG